jgi:hypothetical protein
MASQEVEKDQGGNEQEGPSLVSQLHFRSSDPPNWLIISCEAPSKRLKTVGNAAATAARSPQRLEQLDAKDASQYASANVAGPSAALSPAKQGSPYVVRMPNSAFFNCLQGLNSASHLL